MSRWSFLLILAVIALVAIAYRPILRDPAFLSDDHILLEQAQAPSVANRFVMLPGVPFFRPVGMLAWMGAWRLLGPSPLGFRLVSIALHAINALLVMALVRKLIPRRRRIGADLLPVVVGLLFALSPVHMETVSWPACWYDLLATGFYLATLLLLIETWTSGRLLTAVLACWTCQLALWSKESAFTLPFVALLVWYARRTHRPPDPRPGWRPSARTRRVLLSVAPLVALLAVNLGLRLWIRGDLAGYPSRETTLQEMASNVVSSLSVLVAPLHTCFFADTTRVDWLMALVPLVLCLPFVRHPRLIVFAAAWLVMTLVPVAELLPLTSKLMNGRMVYLPSIGFFVGLAILLDGLVDLIFGRKLALPCMAGTVTFVLAMYVQVLAIQIEPWATASAESRRILADLRRCLGPLPSRARLQMVNVPDNYRGAYLFRLGLEHAYRHRFGAGFDVEWVNRIPVPIAAREHQTIYQLAFTQDPRTDRWTIERMIGPIRPGKTLDDSFDLAAGESPRGRVGPEALPAL